MRDKAVSLPNQARLYTLDRIIHEPARLLIVTHLAAVESADFVFLLRQTGLTKGNLSAHLRTLEAAGYIEVKKEFVERIPRTLLRLSATGREALKEYRRQMKQIIHQ
ncbi:MAG: transcriptional regulator [Calditrichaeota bacterium]|nr:transcriptional regulator [Calditrichota bacterium]